MPDAKPIDEPLIMGGQGRDASDVNRDGSIVGIVAIVMFLTILGGCGWACWVWARGGVS